jgi:hypothetical protein
MAVIEAIKTVYLEADASSVMFSSLGSYEHLQLRMTLKTPQDSADTVTGEMRFGDSAGISTAGYSTHRMYGENTTEAVGIDEGTDAARFYPMASSKSSGLVGEYSCHLLDIFDYRSTVKNVSWMMTAWGPSAATGAYVALQGGIWVKPTLINPMTQFYVQGPTYVSRGSEFTLFGIQE